MKKNIALLLVISACNLQADMKDTGALYHDTTKNVNQTIHLHNMQAEPAKIITTTKIRRVPKYVYYNVYKTKVVWKCKPKVAPVKIKKSWKSRGEGGIGNWSSGGGFKYFISAGVGNATSGDVTSVYITQTPCGKNKLLKKSGNSFNNVCGGTLSWYVTPRYGYLYGTKLKIGTYFNFTYTTN